MKTNEIDHMRQEISQWADCRNCSNEVAEAIFFIASSEKDAERIWQDPTKLEADAIWEYVTRNGMHDAADFSWGIDNLATVLKQMEMV